MWKYTVMVKEINMSGQDFQTLVDAEGHHDIYTMIKIGFAQPLVSLFYIIAVGLLCLHLSHGVSAMFQSLGLKNHVYAPLIDKASKLIAFGLFLGYISIPVAVLLASHSCGGGCCK